MKTATRTPRKGDRVFLARHEGEFEVVKVIKAGKLVELKIINPPPRPSPDYVEKSVPWSALMYPKPLRREDVNQAAERVVREATSRL